MFVVVVCLALGHAQPRLHLLIRSWFCCVLFVVVCLCLVIVVHVLCFDVVLWFRLWFCFAFCFLFVHAMSLCCFFVVSLLLFDVIVFL